MFEEEIHGPVVVPDGDDGIGRSVDDVSVESTTSGASVEEDQQDGGKKI